MAFTDNRQDAALQAGHFNDFAFVTLFRAAILHSLQDAPVGLTDLARRATLRLGFVKANEGLRPHWLRDTTWQGRRLDEAHRVFEETMALRIVQDFRNTWRCTNPNLMRLKLLQVEFAGLSDLVNDQRAFGALATIGQKPNDYGAYAAKGDPIWREKVLVLLLKDMLTGFAIDDEQFGYHKLRELGDESNKKLSDPWALHRDESRQSATVLVTRLPSDARPKDKRELLSAGPRSRLGRRLHALFPGLSLKDKGDDLRDFVDAVLSAARSYGIVKESFGKSDARGWQLDTGCLQFKRGPGDPKRASYGPYFTALYTDCAKLLQEPEHPLFTLEAQEHTAQVDSMERKQRENRFKFTSEAQKKLAEADPERRPKALPLLFCSPTMELGVDISALDVVYLRNVPPTPANYAQRGGRAGRSGQAALVITYCSAHSPHDQYFFTAPNRMVHGEVRPPILDLTNQQMVRSHGQAVWLAATEQKLGAFPCDAVEMNEANYPLKAEIAQKFAANPASTLAAVKQFVQALDPALRDGKAPWYLGPEALAADIAHNAADGFDQSLNRWRNLVTCAERQRDDASRAVANHALSAKEQEHHRWIRESAEDQLRLLMPKGEEAFSNDFHIYRYLATEGFLPGYNFPRLPIFAFIPGQKGLLRRDQTYIARPKFLGISEFGPHSFIYHAGQAYKVNRAIIKAGKDASTEALVPGKRNWSICGECGYGVAKGTASVCPNCQQQLTTQKTASLPHVMPLENVGTESVLRITANDETRSRRGFDLQTTYTWAKRNDRLDVRKVAVSDESGVPVAEVHYGAAAELTRFNKGLRRRAQDSGPGFIIEPRTGFWRSNADEEDGADAATSSTGVRVIPSVQETKNALVLRPRLAPGAPVTDATFPTIQHALLRALHRCFELEEGEVLAEPLPNEKERSGFLLYESTEGGAGVLNRLAPHQSSEDDDPLRDLRSLGAKALSLLHVGTSDGAECVAGCYRCILSYYNQPDHARLDRRDPAALDFFQRLTHAHSSTDQDSLVQRVLDDLTTALPPAVHAWKEKARASKVPEPDHTPLPFKGHTLPLVWKTHRVVALLEADQNLAQALKSRGYEVVQFNAAQEESWGSGFDSLLQVLGKAP